MSMIQDLRIFLLGCPFLRPRSDVGMPVVYVDYLSGDSAVEYQIQIVPSSQIIRKYVDGGGIKQTAFAFVSADQYAGRDIQQSMDNISFYERFAEWLEKTKPSVPNWIKVEALTDGYFFEKNEGEDRAIYQMQCRILYNF